MGKQIYLTDAEIKWLEEKLGNLSEMELYWIDEIERKMLDGIYDKIKKD